MSYGNRQARRAWAAACRKNLQRGKLLQAEIQHDEGCAIYSPARLCNCDPIRILKDDKGRVVARVEGAGFFDPLEFSGVIA